MLSAIAARRAAQLAAQSDESSSISTSPSHPPESEDVTTSSHASPQARPRSSNRTRREEDSESGRTSPVKRPKKKKRNRSTVGDGTGSKKARYFLQNEQVAKPAANAKGKGKEVEMDVIPLESDDNDVEIAVEGTGDEDSSGSEAVLPPPESLSPTRKSKRKVWSPSRPYNSDAVSLGGSRQSSPLNLTSTTALSTFRPTLKQHLSRISAEQVQLLRHFLSPTHPTPGVLLSLEHGETLTLSGTYTLSVLRGFVSICGVKMSASKRCHRVFAPLGFPLPVLEAHSPEEETVDEALLRSLLENLDVSITGQSTLLLIQNLATGVEGLGKVVKSFENAFILPDDDALELDSVSMVTKPSRNVQPYLFPPSWERGLDAAGLANEISSRSELSTIHSDIFLIKGPKKTGKSTFARLVLNRLLLRYRRVAYLECDIGQSEFTPAGMVALNVIERPIFGPPFTHPTLPQFAHYIGSSTPRSSPSYYLSSIQSLIESYKLELRNPAPEDLNEGDKINDEDEDDNRISDVIPLVVNTMGWIKGLGADLNSKIEEIVQPTHIFEFQPTLEPRRRSNSFSGGGGGRRRPSRSIERVEYQNMEGVHYHSVEAIPNNPAVGTSFNAAELRGMALMSYFYATFPSNPSTSSSSHAIPTTVPLYQQLTAESWNTDLPLVAQHPYVVDPSIAFDNFVLTGPGTEDVVSSEIGRVLNGALVAIVKSPYELGEIPEEDAQLQDGGQDHGDEDEKDKDDVVIAKAVRYNQGAPPPNPMTSTCVGLALIRSLDVKPTSTNPEVGSEETKVEIHILTPLPSSLLSRYHLPLPVQSQSQNPTHRQTHPSHSITLLKGELELPIWGFLDCRPDQGHDDDGEGSLKKDQGKVVREGEDVAYLRWEKGVGVAGGVKKAVRRNLMRRGQM